MPRTHLRIGQIEPSSKTTMQTEIPAPLRLPPGVVLPFPWVGSDVTLEQTTTAARLTGLAILGGALARSAVGLAELPFNIPLEPEGEVELLPR